MTIDQRTRMDKEVRALARDQVFDDVITEALATHGVLAARGVTYKGLPGLGLDVEGRAQLHRLQCGRLCRGPSKGCF